MSKSEKNGNTNYDNTFGGRLKLVLKRNNINAHQLSQKIGCSSSIMYQYLNNKRTPTSKKLCKIAKILNVSPEFLLGIDAESVPSIYQKLVVQINSLNEREAELVYQFICALKGNING